MPTSPFKPVEFSLSNAHECGMLLKLKCYLCNSTHRYYPSDVITLCGDIPLDEIASKFSCQKCKTRQYLRADWQSVYGPDVGKTKVRRLVRVRYVRVPIWQEEII